MAWESKKPNSFMKTVKKDAETHMKKLAIVLDANLVKKTPVDEGRALSNWIVTNGAPTDVENKSIDKAGTASTTSAREFKPVFGTPFFLNNNVPYIGFLDKGTESIPAYNIVSRSIAATIRQVG